MTEEEYNSLEPGKWYVVDDGLHDPFTSQLVSLSTPYGQGFWFSFKDTNLVCFSIDELTMIETEPPEDAATD